jgi:hypothetical protein
LITFWLEKQWSNHYFDTSNGWASELIDFLLIFKKSLVKTVASWCPHKVYVYLWYHFSFYSHSWYYFLMIYWSVEQFHRYLEFEWQCKGTLFLQFIMVLIIWDYLEVKMSWCTTPHISKVNHIMFMCRDVYHISTVNRANIWCV